VDSHATWQPTEFVYLFAAEKQLQESDPRNQERGERTKSFHQRSK